MHTYHRASCSLCVCVQLKQQARAMESMMKASPGKGKGRGKGGGRTKAEMRGAHNEGTIEMAPTPVSYTHLTLPTNKAV